MLSDNTKFSSKTEHQKVWDLLPWYINRTLDSAEKETVHNHVRTCIACRIELNQQQLIFEKMTQPDWVRQVSQVSFNQLKNRIAKRPQIYVISQQEKRIEKLPALSDRGVSFLKHAALAASIVMFALPFMLSSSIDQQKFGNEYRTLASAPAGKQSYNILRIVFADPLSSEKINAILDSVSGEILSGPSDNGVYEVRIGGHQSSLQVVKAAIMQLKNNQEVVFAELAHGLPASK